MMIRRLKWEKWPSEGEEEKKPTVERDGTFGGLMPLLPWTTGSRIPREKHPAAVERCPFARKKRPCKPATYFGAGGRDLSWPEQVSACPSPSQPARNQSPACSTFQQRSTPPPPQFWGKGHSCAGGGGGERGQRKDWAGALSCVLRPPGGRIRPCLRPS